MGVPINQFAVREMVGLSCGTTSLFTTCSVLEIWWLKLQPKLCSEMGVPVLRPPELFQSCSQGFKSSIHAIQIIHSRSNHWIVATTLQCDPGEVKIYNSVYKSLDTETLEVVKRLFGSENKPLTVSMVTGAPRQQGSTDCGVFAIAVATCLAFGGDPTKMMLHQTNMRSELLKRFGSKQLTQFQL